MSLSLSKGKIIVTDGTDWSYIKDFALDTYYNENSNYYNTEFENLYSFMSTRSLRNGKGILPGKPVFRPSLERMAYMFCLRLWWHDHIFRGDLGVECFRDYLRRKRVKNNDAIKGAFRAFSRLVVEESKYCAPTGG